MKTVSFCLIHGLCVPDDQDYLAMVRDILESDEFYSMQSYIQHGETSCLTHSIYVSYLSYLFCTKHHRNARAAARAGLLHDLFLYDWHVRKRQKGEKPHGFEHPRKALENARSLFSLNMVEENAILRHMWPLTLTPPKFLESYVITAYDKICSVMETLYLPPLLMTDTVDA